MKTVAVILNIAFFGAVWIVWAIAGFSTKIAIEYWFWLVVFLLYPVINILAISGSEHTDPVDDPAKLGEKCEKSEKKVTKALGKIPIKDSVKTVNKVPEKTLSAT